MSGIDIQHVVDVSSSLRAHHFHVADKYGFVFCTIPKNAHRTIKRYLLDLASVDHRHIPDIDLHKLCEEKTSLVRYPVYMRPAILTKLPVYVIVRDPYERIASAFSDRVVRPEMREQNLPMYEWVNGKGCGFQRGISFAEFVRYLNVHPDSVLDHHWRSQASFFRGVNAEILGDISSVNAALSKLVNRFRLPIPAPADRPRKTAAPWTGGGALGDSFWRAS